MITKIRNFVMEVVVELKKVSWSTRQELIEATWVVLISTAIVAVYIGFVDYCLSHIVGTLMK